jgi:hypothetical protein
MARLAGIERTTVNETMVARVRRLKSEQEGGQRLMIHRLDDSLRGPRDRDGSQHFDVNHLVPGHFQFVDILI